MSNETVTVNRNCKDTVFRKLFSNKSTCLELYNALNKTDYADDSEFEIVTLESAVYMSRKNDLAFVLDYRLSLYEHQSTHNPNIPLRDLFYISSEYQKMITNKSLYASTPVFVPTPHFVVFYNGTDERPEWEILKLSDLYNIKESEPMLELQVLVLNINEGFNDELKRDCRTLYEYMVFVERIHMYRNEGCSLDEAVVQAVDECIDEGILKDFLLANKAEVIAVSIFEFDEEKEWRLFGEAEREAGREAGREEGRKEGREEGRREERKELMVSLVKDGILSIAEASTRLNISEEELKKYV